jgi:carboxypeptidase-like protein
VKLKIVFTGLFFACIAMSAQTKGIIKDSLTGKPLPFVSIWVENENIGRTSEEDGTFEIHTTENSRNLIFSSLGYEKKKVAIGTTAIVFLNPTALQLDEVIVQNRKETKRIEIGQTGGGILEAFENGARIDVKFFPYSKDYKKAKFIKKISIKTDSQIEASLKIHFYSVDANGFPGSELLSRDFIVTVSKGNLRTTFDVTKFNLIMPKNGLFVGFEKLMIEKNKVEKTTANNDTNITVTKKTYAPMVLYNWVARDFIFTFSAGKWNKQTNAANPGDKMMVNEPAINLILTN